MRQKPSRKNTHKEKIFTLNQNKVNFAYQKMHQEGPENRVHGCCAGCNADQSSQARRKGAHVA